MKSHFFNQKRNKYKSLRTKAEPKNNFRSKIKLISLFEDQIFFFTNSRKHHVTYSVRNCGTKPQVVLKLLNYRYPK